MLNVRMQLNVSRAAVSGPVTQINLDSLPVEHEEKGLRSVGIILAVFSLIWGGFPTVILITSLVQGKFEPGMLLILLFTVIGAGLFFLGISLIFRRKKTRIDKDGVMVEQRSLFGLKLWNEPFSRYKGVGIREEYHSGGKNSPSYTLYIVELVHDDKDKIVQLYCSKSAEGHRKIWEDYCRKLNMQAVEKDGDSYVTRDVGDIDKTVSELVREGKIELDFDPSRNIPPELEVISEGDELVITVFKPKRSAVGAVFGVLLWVVLPAGFIYAGFFTKDAPIIFGFVGIIILLVIFAVIFISTMTKARLRVSSDGASTCRISLWGEWFTQSINSPEVESVKVYKEDRANGEAVWLSGDKGSICFGEGLGRETLEWLRGCILKVFSGGG
jgi:uncharacterized membrane protein